MTIFGNQGYNSKNEGNMRHIDGVEIQKVRIPYKRPVLTLLQDLRDITLGATPDGNESGGGGDFSVEVPFTTGSTDSSSAEPRSERSSSSDVR